MGTDHTGRPPSCPTHVRRSRRRKTKLRHRCTSHGNPIQCSTSQNSSTITNGVLFIFLIVCNPIQSGLPGSRSSQLTDPQPGSFHSSGHSNADIEREQRGRACAQLLLVTLTQRIREIDNPAIIIQRTPGQVSFLDPLQLIEAPIAAVVPRAIWPSKPIQDTGAQVSQQY